MMFELKNLPKGRISPFTFNLLAGRACSAWRGYGWVSSWSAACKGQIGPYFNLQSSSVLCLHIVRRCWLWAVNTTARTRFCPSRRCFPCRIRSCGLICYLASIIFVLESSLQSEWCEESCRRSQVAIFPCGWWPSQSAQCLSRVQAKFVRFYCMHVVLLATSTDSDDPQWCWDNFIQYRSMKSGMCWALRSFHEAYVTHWCQRMMYVSSWPASWTSINCAASALTLSQEITTSTSASPLLLASSCRFETSLVAQIVYVSDVLAGGTLGAIWNLPDHQRQPGNLNFAYFLLR